MDKAAGEPKLKTNTCNDDNYVLQHSKRIKNLSLFFDNDSVIIDRVGLITRARAMLNYRNAEPKMSRAESVFCG